MVNAENEGEHLDKVTKIVLDYNGFQSLYQSGIKEYNYTDLHKFIDRFLANLFTILYC